MLANFQVDPIRIDHVCRPHRLVILKTDLGVRIGLNDVDASARKMDRVRLQLADAVNQHGMQVAPMQQGVGKAVALLRRSAEIVPVPRLTGAPMTDFLSQRCNLNGIERLFEPEFVQNGCAVRADLDAGTQLPQPGGLLIDLDIEPAPEQRE
jgi:hypothetical protein